ncbi:hypothetical protein [Mariprofundus ferrooxydans]|uniref:hypothetical protein n=1 Tax=Mariprofundus ferrooxydans TaxID=314344 RepID=UPI00142F9310|nr:hypothetical protein [Mariprofundus ferrooxydans]
MTGMFFAVACWGFWYMSPHHVAMLAYDHDAIVSGEWWRLWTAHLVHLRYRDLLINSGMLFLFGLLSVRFTRLWQEILSFAVAMPIITGLLLITSPHTLLYRGAFGIAAMTTMVACWFLILENKRFSLGYWLGCLFLLLFVAKVGLDGLAVLSISQSSRATAGVAWMVEIYGTLTGLAFFNALHQGKITRAGNNPQYWGDTPPPRRPHSSGRTPPHG